MIVVPKGVPKLEALGMLAIDGHVVRTVRLHEGSPERDPGWVVDPPQRIEVLKAMMTPIGPLFPGEKLPLICVPDRFLRPFPDIAPDELADAGAAVSRAREPAR
jgi:hypothetical protein